MINLKAKLKSTGEIVTVYKCDGCYNTEYYQDANNEHKKYAGSQLNFDFIPPLRGVLNPKHPASPFEPYDLMSCDPMQMAYDNVNHIARFEQILHIQMTEKIIANALRMASDQQLKEELKRREDELRRLNNIKKNDIRRCYDCFYSRQRTPCGLSRDDFAWFCINKPLCDKARRPEDFQTIQIDDAACEDFELSR